MTTRPLLPVSSAMGGATAARGAARSVLCGSLLSGKALALLLSVCVHSVAALALARAAPRTSPQVATLPNAPIEIYAADLTLTEVSASLAPLPSDTPKPNESEPDSPHARTVLPRAHAIQEAPATQTEGEPLPGAAPAVIDSPASPVPPFVLTVGSAARSPGSASAPEGQSGAPSSGAMAGPVPEASVDTPATLLAGNSPNYTRDAETAGVEADVPLEIVVDEAGAVVGARALQHVGYGLDEAALRAVRAYRFSPARHAGRVQAVRMRWIMRFQLR